MDNFINVRASQEADISLILDLQARNQFDSLTEIERNDGFLVTKFQSNEIQLLMNEGGVFIVEDNNKIIGYALAGRWDFFLQWPIFESMVIKFNNLIFKSKKLSLENSFQYGPVCIDKNYRGDGLLQKLFFKICSNFVSDYSFGMTFINENNIRSYMAHTKKLGMVNVGKFTFNQSSYYILAFDTVSGLAG